MVILKKQICKNRWDRKLRNARLLRISIKALVPALLNPTTALYLYNALFVHNIWFAHSIYLARQVSFQLHSFQAVFPSLLCRKWNIHYRHLYRGCNIPTQSSRLSFRLLIVIISKRLDCMMMASPAAWWYLCTFISRCTCRTCSIKIYIDLIFKIK